MPMFRKNWLLCLCILPGSVLALPQGATVTSGSASLDTAGNQLTVQQHSERVAIHYDSFDINAAETVRFVQPGRDSVALNRVLGPDASVIAGRLQANGQVFLINPNGVLFSPGANVDVGGLLATSLNLADEDFVAGDYRFAADGEAGDLLNQGHLRALPQGYVVLLANHVTNQGTIDAPGGQVAMVSADQVLVQIGGSEVAIETNTASWQGLVENEGSIQADGGLVLLKADTASDLYRTVVANEGHIQAQRLEERDGEIWLVGSDAGDVWQSGELDVSAGESSPGAGGRIEIRGHRVAHTGQSDANGYGGTERADGGSVQLYADEKVVLTDASALHADGAGKGDGGTVKVFSPDTALFRADADISARAGSEGGDGGFVDVSGWQQVEAAGRVDVSAPAGETGTFLIDPFDITIAGADTSGSFDGGSPDNTWTPAATGSTIDSATITANLATANVIIQTAGGGGAEAGNITVNNIIDLDGSNGNQLSLVADGALTLNADIADQNTLTTDDTNLVFTASGGFTVTPGVQVDAGGGTIAITSSANVDLSGIRTTSADAAAVSVIANGTISGNGAGVDIEAVNGTLLLNGVAGINSVDTQVAAMTLAGSGNAGVSETDDLALTVTGAFNNLAVTAGGDLTLADAPVTAAGTLSLAAADIADSDRALVLNAPDLVLSTSLANGDTLVDTTATTASVTTSGAGEFSLNKTDAGNLSLGTLSVAAGSFAATLANGQLTLPAAVTVPGVLSVSASDLVVSSISSQDLLLDLSGGAADLAINTTVERADISVTGRGLQITEADGLELADLNADGVALNADNGDLTVTVDAGNLAVNADLLASDTVADGTRTGLIDLSVNGGNFSAGSAGAVQVISTNTLDQGAAGGLGAGAGNQTAIRIRQLDASDQSAAFTLGNGRGSDVLIQAEGGDILMDAAGGASLSTGNTRPLQINSDVTITAFNNAADPANGVVTVEGINNSGTLLARTGRSVTLTGVSANPFDPGGNDNSPGVSDGTNDVLDTPDADGGPQDLTPGDIKTPLDLLFSDVFGDCTRNNERREPSCEVESALKRFMGSLLIGGELPE